MCPVWTTSQPFRLKRIGGRGWTSRPRALPWAFTSQPIRLNSKAFNTLNHNTLQRNRQFYILA
jgi:hypothetical protein